MAAQCAIALRQARLYLSSQAQVTELKKLSQIRDNFLAAVSHELRTPLTSISLSVHLLKLSHQVSPLTPKQIQYLEVLEQACEREISLINDLLDLQNLSGNTLKLPSEQVNLPLLLAPLINRFQDRMRKRQQTLEVHWDPHLPYLHTHPRLLERLVCELLTNAHKFTPAGEHIVLEAVALGSDRWELRLTNTGTTIPLEEQERIFEQFYRIPHSDPWQQGGTGLGLALAQAMANHLGGSLQVESTAHQTTFVLRLPVAKSC
jgi:signal transduction histidine kinase